MTHGLADDIAHEENVRHVGAHLNIDVDKVTLRNGHTGFVSSNLLAVGGAAYGLQYQVAGLGRGGRAALLANR